MEIVKIKKITYDNNDNVCYQYKINNRNNSGFAIIYLSFSEPHKLRNNKIYYTNKECTLVFIKTKKKYRNKGYATNLLNFIKQICIEKKIYKIVLDDCSDNFNKPNNLYLKNGFKYINLNEPEMICEL